MAKLNHTKISIKDKVFWINMWYRFKTGDRFAFKEIYTEFVDSLFAYGLSFTSNKELLKDCIQDLFIDLYRYKIELRNPENLEFYLFKSLKRLILKKLKRNSRIDYFDSTESLDLSFKFDLEDNYINNESEILSFQKLHKALNELTPKKRELLFYKFNSNLSYKEIAQLTGYKKEAVKKQIYRIILKLRKEFEGKSTVN